MPPHRVPSRARNRDSRVVNHERPVRWRRPSLRIMGKTGAGDVVTVVVTSVGESGHETARARVEGANGREAGSEKPVALGASRSSGRYAAAAVADRRAASAVVLPIGRPAA